MKNPESILVGIPLYDGEKPETLHACLENIDKGLNRIDRNVNIQGIVVGINGPRTSMSRTPLCGTVVSSRYNADVRVIHTPPGIVRATKTIAQFALNRGIGRICLTDADIWRFPLALRNLYDAACKPVAGANYSAYPPELLIEAGVPVTEQELRLARIFEADKSPLARPFTTGYRPANRLRGSLLLVEAARVLSMYGCQSITSDSQMNMNVPSEERQLVPYAAYLHPPRFDLTDHIQARLRHWRAAYAAGCLDEFRARSNIYRNNAESIAQQILTQQDGGAPQAASDFLLQCALRNEVSRICASTVLGKPYRTQRASNSGLFSGNVTSLVEADNVIRGLVSDQTVWDRLKDPVTKGSGTTQDSPVREPVDFGKFMQSTAHRNIIYGRLGLTDQSIEI